MLSLVPAMSLRQVKFDPSGVLRLAEHVLWWAEHADGRTSRPGLVPALFAADPTLLYHLPVADIANRLGARLPGLMDVLRGPNEAHGCPEAITDDELAALPVPALHVGGWYDLLLPETLHHWSTVGSTLGERPPRRLVLGPWTHDLTATPPTVGARSHGPSSRVALGRLQVNWLRSVLDPGFGQPSSQASVFLVGSDGWWNGQTWPPDATRELTLFADRHGDLITAAPTAIGENEFRCDPLDPFPSRELATDRVDLASRADAARYTTAPLASSTTLAGTPTARLRVAGSAPCTDWVARLLELTASGQHISVAHGSFVAHGNTSPACHDLNARPYLIMTLPFENPDMPPGWVSYGAHVAPTEVYAPWQVDRYGFGAAIGDPGRARRAAVGEAVERYCGNIVPTDLPFGSYYSLTSAGREAIDPHSLALYSDQQYATPGFPFSPLTPDTSIGWVTGCDLHTGRTVLAPASLAYLNYYRGARVGEPPTNALCYAGIAAGENIEHAEGSALAELFERDALALWWASGAPANLVSDGGGIADLLADPRSDSRRIRLLDIPSPFGVPVVGAFIEDHKHAVIAFGGACRSTPVEAAKKALAEAFGLLSLTLQLTDPYSEVWRAVKSGTFGPRVFRPFRADRAYRRQFRSDFRDLTDLPLIAQLYLDPLMQGAPLDRLRPPAPGTPLAALPAIVDPDPRADYLRRLQKSGLRAVSIDLTNPRRGSGRFARRSRDRPQALRERRASVPVPRRSASLRGPRRARLGPRPCERDHPGPPSPAAGVVVWPRPTPSSSTRGQGSSADWSDRRSPATSRRHSRSSAASCPTPSSSVLGPAMRLVRVTPSTMKPPQPRQPLERPSNGTAETWSRPGCARRAMTRWQQTA
ncbi:MAG: CocE/NonD family hydrolase [Pseudonocardiales bacterium]|nr:CocE/NonD family hydrolase [Pseudonocardiales bacterium]